ncbi:MAG: chromosomal replication initiator protein DnaA, partial [Burkholderiaceae bacterium]
TQQYQTWIQPLRYEGTQHQGRSWQIRLSAPNRFKQVWARDQIVAPLAAWIADQSNQTVQIEISVNAEIDDPPQGAHRRQENGSVDTLNPQSPQTSLGMPSAGTAPSSSSQHHRTQEDLKAANHARLNQEWTFDAFVPGKANQLARAAALQVSENPGSGYNPLFLYGGVGLGKSHLIHAIGNSLHQRLPGAKIRYIHAETYVSDVVKAYQRKSFDEFKKYYHSLDLLLIDDIQFFAGKSRTQEEFFYAFEALIAAKKQLIITSDTYPTELGGIDQRLISRFGSGLTVAIEPPELEMRVAILLRKAETEQLALDEDVAFFIARQLRSNVRELEGALRKIVAYCQFHQTTPSLEHVKEALRDLLSIQKTSLSVENIQKIVSDFYKIKVAEMYSKRRPASIALPRQIAMYLAKELTQKSLPEIGDLFGGRDHTTVLHAIRKIQTLRQQNAELNREIHILEQQIRT